MGLIPEWGRSPGGGNGSSLQYSCLDNSMNRGALGGRWGGGSAAYIPWGCKESDMTEHTHGTHTQYAGLGQENLTNFKLVNQILCGSENPEICRKS